MALLRVGTRVRTIDRGARVHGRSPDKPEAIGIIRDHHRPYGRQSKDRAPPYYVTFETGEAAWYDAAEVEPARGARTSIKSSGQHATKKSPAQLEREIAEALAGRRAHATKEAGALSDLEEKLSSSIRALPMGAARISPEAEWLNLAWRVVRVAGGRARAQRGSSRAEAAKIAARIDDGEHVPIDALRKVVLSASEREFIARGMK
jgi:hypothetical protein